MCFVLCLCADDYACLWKGCEFLAMGSPRELEVHAHFHTYHSKLKFIGGQLLATHPNLPNCKQDLHCNNLSSESSAGLLCLWQHCDVCWSVGGPFKAQFRSKVCNQTACKRITR